MNDQNNLSRRSFKYFQERKRLEDILKTEFIFSKVQKINCKSRFIISSITDSYGLLHKD